MSVFYKMSYRVGFHPWEDLAHHKPFADALVGLFEREERGKEPPYGKALDLGCGRATWGVPLAKRGWQVTGVDNVPKAVARAVVAKELARIVYYVLAKQEAFNGTFKGTPLSRTKHPTWPRLASPPV